MRDILLFALIFGVGVFCGALFFSEEVEPDEIVCTQYACALDRQAIAEIIRKSNSTCM